MRCRPLVPPALGLAAVVLAVVAASASADTAREILDRRQALEDGPRKWTDREERLSLVIQDGRGGERKRELTRFERRGNGEDTKTIVFFHAPAEVKGTGFLSIGHDDAPADQWLYLPELRRVRQITTRARGESFVGTDLTYADLDMLADMPWWTEADARSRLRGEEPVDGAGSWVIELDPQSDTIPYDTIVLWLAKDDLVPRRIELFADGTAEPTKRIRQRDVRMVGAVPVPHEVEVATLAKGSRTLVTTASVRLDTGLAEDLFTQRALERGEP